MMTHAPPEARALDLSRPNPKELMILGVYALNAVSGPLLHIVIMT